MKLTSRQKRTRIFMMMFGAFAIFFTGFPHVWSLYQPYVMEQTGWSQGQASMCFYLPMILFVFGNIIGGRIQDKYNPKITIVIGGGIFAAGIIASSFLMIKSPIPMYLTYGMMQGFGQGMIYTTIVSTAQKWLPHKTGLASGIVVTANGLCGFFLTPISRNMLEKSDPQTALFAIGCAIAAAWIFGCVFIKNPDKELSAQLAANVQNNQSVPEQKQYTSSEMIRTKKFYLLVMTMLCGLMSYFIVSPVSQTIQASRGINAGTAASAIMIGSVLNAVVRLVLPTLSDKLGRAKCIRWVIIMIIAAMGILIVSRSYMTTAAVILLYACYGGIMGSFPSFTSSIFGLRHSGENYGIVMSGIIVASLGAPAITNMVTAKGLDLNIAFQAGIAFAVAALVFIILLEKELKKERTAKPAVHTAKRFLNIKILKQHRNLA